MGWRRVGGQRYYYRSVRVGGRVRSRYCGDGWLGELFEEDARIGRSERRERRAAERAERDDCRRELADLAEWYGAVEVLATAALLATGHHRHRRQWRRRRWPVADATAGDLPATASGTAPARLTWGDLNALVEKAEGGDAGALTEVRRAIRSGHYPNWSRWFLDRRGNPAVWAENALVATFPGDKHPVDAGSLRANLERVRRELAGENPTAIEAILAERASLCWQAVNVYELIYESSRNLTIKQAEFQLRKCESAHRKFLAAVATLAKVRRLAVPVLQVNAAVANVAQVVAVPGGSSTRT